MITMIEIEAHQCLSPRKNYSHYWSYKAQILTIQYLIELLLWMLSTVMLWEFVMAENIEKLILS
jgi:hypothetical protein